MLDVAELGVLAKIPINVDIACSSSCALELVPNPCPSRNLAEIPMVCPFSATMERSRILTSTEHRMIDLCRRWMDASNIRAV